MKMIKEDVDFQQANSLLFSLGNVLTDEVKERFYKNVQAARNSDNPRLLVEIVIANIVILGAIEDE